ncbi:MAG: hypothetical protein AAF581_15180 [Planctomycetota bacterium]
MSRIIIATIAGFILWSVLWVAGGLGLAMAFPDEQKAFTEGGALDATPYLASALVLSVICSLLAGLANAAISKDSSRSAVITMVILLIAVGALVQASVWKQMPLWYHATFLVLLLPMCMLGARLKKA